MSVSSSTLRKLAELRLDPDQMAGVLELLAEQQEVEEARKAAQRDRTRRSRAKRDGNVTDTPPSHDGNAAVSPKKENSPTPPKEKTTPSSTEPNGSSKTRASRLPADWVLPFEWRQDAINAGLPEDRIASEAERMRDWSLSAPSGAKLNWRAAWRNWAKGAAEKLPKRAQSPPSQRQQPKGADHFDNFAEELRHGRAGNSRGNQGDWDDVAGVPVLSIEHYRRNA